MLAKLLELAEQAFQRRPAFEINDFTGAFVQCRAVVLCIVDIKAYVDYSMVYRRLFLPLVSVA